MKLTNITMYPYGQYIETHVHAELYSTYDIVLDVLEFSKVLKLANFQIEKDESKVRIVCTRFTKKQSRRIINYLYSVGQIKGYDWTDDDGYTFMY